MDKFWAEGFYDDIPDAKLHLFNVARSRDFPERVPVEPMVIFEFHAIFVSQYGPSQKAVNVTISQKVDFLSLMLRTHTCGALTEKNDKQEVTLCGWVHLRRDHGGLMFIDLRDRYGFTQVVFHPEKKDIFAAAEKVRPEWVIQVKGKVAKRLPGAERKDQATGMIEVHADELVVLNQAKTPPFEIDSDKPVNEELRLQYRYLDMRREQMQRNLALRSKVFQIIRRYFTEQGCLEIDTPCLIKGTPEGAREYIVPSRLYPGNFFVLPQSPQQLKQLCMVGGLDRYFQIARCFRDED